MRHALIEENKVVNIIEIDPRNASDFKNAVTVPEEIGADIGDIYENGRFYRMNPETQGKEEILPPDPSVPFLEMIQNQQNRLSKLTVDTDYRLLMLEFGSQTQI